MTNQLSLRPLLPKYLPPTAFARIVLGKPISQTNVRSKTRRYQNSDRYRYREVVISVKDTHSGMEVASVKENWMVLNEEDREVTPEIWDRIQSYKGKYSNLLRHVLSYPRPRAEEFDQL